MNNVLLIGDDSFTDGVTTQVRGFDSLAVTTVERAENAVPVLSAAIPDVLIVQADKLTEGSVHRTFALERANTYTIVIENTLSSGAELGLSVQQISELRLERTAFALEAGADAYLWLPPFYSNACDGTCDEMSAAAEASEESALRRLGDDTDDQLAEGHLKVRQSARVESGRLESGRLESGRLESGRLESGRLESGRLERSPIKLHPSQSRLIQAHIQLGLNQAQRYRDLSRINDWLSAVALVDALTQLNNRRSFDLELPRKIKVARAKSMPFSLMVIDIDYFKRVNDRYGHLVGDDVLKLLAKRLLTNMRFYDTPFRYGGEEFVVTLSNTDLAEGIVIAQRLRQSISQTPFEISSDLSDVGSLALTISIGLTDLKAEDDDQGRSCLNRADQLLLKAKSGGRDQVMGE